MLDDFAMIVVSCDAYHELGKTFFDLQTKYMDWFENPRYYINESKEISFDGVKVIHVGLDVDWSGKVQRALKSIPEKYILFMLEDYFIGKEVKEYHLDEALETMKLHDLRYYKITAIPQIYGHSTIKDYIAAIPSNLRYGINLQAAIFERSFLAEIVSGEDRSAWKTETDLLLAVTDKYEYDIPGCVLDKRNIIDIHNGVIKGKWVPDTVAYFKKRGYPINLGSREMLRRREIIKMKTMRGISHLLPTPLVRKIKAVLGKLGVRFVSDN